MLSNLLLFPSPVLLKFRTDKGRDPSCDTFGEDSELLLQIRNDVLDSLGVNPDLLPEDFVRLVSACIRLAWIDKHLRICLNLGGALLRPKALRGASWARFCQFHRPLTLRWCSHSL